MTHEYTPRLENVQKFPERTQNSDERAFLSSIAVKKIARVLPSKRSLWVIGSSVGGIVLHKAKKVLS